MGVSANNPCNAICLYDLTPRVDIWPVEVLPDLVRIIMLENEDLLSRRLGFLYFVTKLACLLV
jgi:hypothetical protein